MASDESLWKIRPLKENSPLVLLQSENLRFLSDGAAGENFGNLVQFSIGFCLRNRDFNSLKPQKFPPAAPKNVQYLPWLQHNQLIPFRILQNNSDQTFRAICYTRGSRSWPPPEWKIIHKNLTFFWWHRRPILNRSEAPQTFPHAISIIIRS